MTLLMITVLLLGKAGWLTGTSMDRTKNKINILGKKFFMKCG